MSLIIINTINHHETPYAKEQFFDFLTFAGNKNTSAAVLTGTEVKFHIEGYQQLQNIRKVLNHFSNKRFIITVVTNRRILSQVVESNNILQTLSIPRIDGMDVNFKELFYNHNLIVNMKKRCGVYAIDNGVICSVNDIHHNEYNLLAITLFSSSTICNYSNSSEYSKTIQFKAGNKFLVRQNNYEEKLSEQKLICEFIKEYYSTVEVKIRDQYLAIEDSFAIDDEIKMTALAA